MTTMISLLGLSLILIYGPGNGGLVSETNLPKITKANGCGRRVQTQAAGLSCHPRWSSTPAPHRPLQLVLSRLQVFLQSSFNSYNNPMKLVPGWPPCCTHTAQRWSVTRPRSRSQEVTVPGFRPNRPTPKPMLYFSLCVSVCKKTDDSRKERKRFCHVRDLRWPILVTVNMY